jgi:general transcription factor 3C polypeptide 3 (transcription factor C subunit 4)
MLGLSHLAIPYYSLVLKPVAGQDGPLREDLMVDAAYNLQSIYSIAGNPDMVNNVTYVI